MIKWKNFFKASLLNILLEQEAADSVVCFLIALIEVYNLLQYSEMLRSYVFDEF